MARAPSPAREGACAPRKKAPVGNLGDGRSAARCKQLRGRQGVAGAMVSSAPNAADVESIDSIITAAYRLISGKAGEKRDWDLIRSLYAPGARLIPTTKQAGVAVPDGETPTSMDVDGYMARVGDYFDKNGFIETEV